MSRLFGRRSRTSPAVVTDAGAAASAAAHASQLAENEDRRRDSDAARRQQALENMAERSDSPAIGALVNALRQTEKYGTPLAGSLRILSQEFRQTRQSKAEEKGARMPALMTVPLMVFILPTLITVLIAPAIMSALSLT